MKLHGHYGPVDRQLVKVEVIRSQDNLDGSGVIRRVGQKTACGAQGRLKESMSHPICDGRMQDPGRGDDR